MHWCSQQQSLPHGSWPSSQDCPNSTWTQHADHQKLLAGSLQVLSPSHGYARNYKPDVPFSWRTCQAGVWSTDCMCQQGIGTQTHRLLPTTRFVGDTPPSGTYMRRKHDKLIISNSHNTRKQDHNRKVLQISKIKVRLITCIVCVVIDQH